MAAPVPESQASAYSKPRMRAGRLPCVLPSPALPPPGSMRRKWSRVTWCHPREDRRATRDRQAATACGGWRAGHQRAYRAKGATNNTDVSRTSNVMPLERPDAPYGGAPPHCSRRLRTFSITVSNPARNAVASAKSSVGPPPTASNPTSIRSSNPPRNAALRFARLHNVT